MGFLNMDTDWSKRLVWRFESQFKGFLESLMNSSNWDSSSFTVMRLVVKGRSRGTRGERPSSCFTKSSRMLSSLERFPGRVV